MKLSTEGNNNTIYNRLIRLTRQLVLKGERKLSANMVLTKQELEAIDKISDKRSVDSLYDPMSIIITDKISILVGTTNAYTSLADKDKKIQSYIIHNLQEPTYIKTIIMHSDYILNKIEMENSIGFDEDIILLFNTLVTTIAQVLKAYVGYLPMGGSYFKSGEVKTIAKRIVGNVLLDIKLIDEEIYYSLVRDKKYKDIPVYESADDLVADLDLRIY